MYILEATSSQLHRARNAPLVHKLCNINLNVDRWNLLARWLIISTCSLYFSYLHTSGNLIYNRCEVRVTLMLKLMLISRRKKIQNKIIYRINIISSQYQLYRKGKEKLVLELIRIAQTCLCCLTRVTIPPGELLSG